MTRKTLASAVRVSALLGVVGCAVWFALRLDWREVAAAFRGADPVAVGLALLVGIPCSVLGGLRWAALVRPIHPLPRRRAVAVMFVTQAAGALLPLRAGEAVRAELLARATGLSRAASFGTIALDHLVNGAVMFAFAAALPLVLPVPRWIAALVWGGMLAMLVLLAVAVAAVRAPDATHQGRVRALLERMRRGLAGLQHPRAVLAGAAYAAGAWALEIVQTCFALAAFHLPHDPAHAMGVLFGVNLAQALPQPPASLGNFEIGAGMAMVAFGGAQDRAAAFALGFHALTLVPILAFGALLLPAARRASAASPAPSSSSGAPSPDRAPTW